MRIAMVASESNPLIKTGGLGDVIWSLSHQLTQLGHETCVVLPYYDSVKNLPWVKVKKVGSYEVTLSWRHQTADIFLFNFMGLPFYLISNDFYFNRERCYGYEDDGERFAFFVLAVKQLFPYLGLHMDVIHVHDWQTGMLPVLIREQCQDEPAYKGTKLVITLHNEDFKGYLDRYFLNHFFGLDDRLYESGAVRFDGMLSTLKAGIVYADKIVAVSPSHAEELLRPDDPMRLAGVLKTRKDDFLGIVNGIDIEEFDPEHDPFIAKNYNAKTVNEGKDASRQRIIFHYDLEQDDAPVFGIVSRLTYQKGIDLVLRLGEEILEEGGKFFILGAGDEELEARMEYLRQRYPSRCAVYRGYNNQLAHDIYAASDFFLMPSLFEPCGIGQMLAQRYGTLPICRNVGGLRDTVIGYDGNNLKEANGFLFNDFSLEEFRAAKNLALGCFADGKKMKKLIANAMSTDHSWRKSAEKYLALYESIPAR